MSIFSFVFFLIKKVGTEDVISNLKIVLIESWQVVKSQLNCYTLPPVHLLYAPYQGPLLHKTNVCVFLPSKNLVFDQDEISNNLTKIWFLILKFYNGFKKL